MKKTKFFNNEERKWVLIDAKDQILGRFSTRIARILRGKHKATFTPNFLCGDRVIVVNAQHIRVTGKKMDDKIYDKYSGYPSGRKEITLKNLMAKNPTKALQLSIKGMLPKNALGKRMLRSLRIYPDSNYKQQAQKPQSVTV